MISKLLPLQIQPSLFFRYPQNSSGHPRTPASLNQKTCKNFQGHVRNSLRSLCVLFVICIITSDISADTQKVGLVDGRRRIVKCSFDPCFRRFKHAFYFSIEYIRMFLRKRMGRSVCTALRESQPLVIPILHTYRCAIVSTGTACTRYRCLMLSGGQQV